MSDAVAAPDEQRTGAARPETQDSPLATTASPSANTSPVGSKRLTILLRRIHMYLGLFLMPWVIVYGLSAIVMNHLPFFRDWYGKDWGRFVVDNQTTWDNPLPAGADAQAVASAILQDLNLDGAHWINARRNGSRITIHRNGVIYPRRITYSPADGRIIIERQVFQWPLFLRRLHVRRGYGTGYLADNVWALVVDLFIAAALAWGGTGLWTWYKMKKTRTWGALCAAVGCVLFAVFLVTI